MSKQAPKAGDFKLSTQIFLASYQSETGKSEPLRIDIVEAVQEIHIFEGINYDTLSGSLVIVDAGGLLDRFDGLIFAIPSGLFIYYILW